MERGTFVKIVRPNQVPRSVKLSKDQFMLVEAGLIQGEDDQNYHVSTVWKDKSRIIVRVVKVAKDVVEVIKNDVVGPFMDLYNLFKELFSRLPYAIEQNTRVYRLTLRYAPSKGTYPHIISYEEIPNESPEIGPLPLILIKHEKSMATARKQLRKWLEDNKYIA